MAVTNLLLTGCPLPDPGPVAMEDLVRQILLGDAGIPTTPARNLFARTVTDSVAPAATVAEHVFGLEQARFGPADLDGALVFSESPPVSLPPGGYAVWVQPDEDTILVAANPGDAEAFTRAMLEAVRLARQDDGSLPQGLFMRDTRPRFAYRGFHVSPALAEIYRSEALYETGRAAALLGLNRVVLGLSVSLLDTSLLDVQQWPCLDMFEPTGGGVAVDDVRSAAGQLKSDYPIELEPEVRVAKTGYDSTVYKEAYLEPLWPGAPPEFADDKRRCVDITKDGIVDSMVSLIELGRYFAGTDLPSIAGPPASSYVHLGTDEPYTVLASRSEAERAVAGITYGNYVNDLSLAARNALGDDVRYPFWHDPFYCDPGGGIHPNNGCADWPEWMQDLVPGWSRGPLADGLGRLTNDRLVPGVWIYRDYATGEFEEVLDAFAQAGFGEAVCATLGTGDGSGQPPSTLANVLHFGQACENRGGLGLLQTAWTQIGSYEATIVLAALVADYGYLPWMEQLDEEILSAFRERLDYHPADLLSGP